MHAPTVLALTCVACALACAAGLAPARAASSLATPPSSALPAPSSSAIAAYADNVARYWQHHLDARGRLHDPLTKKPGRSYGPTMIGYAMVRAGVRAGDQRLIGDGIRTIEARAHVTVRLRGVFDILGFATAYNYARAHLAHDPRFRAVRHQWVHYLRTIRAAHESALVHGCVISPTCFHNHEAVGALAYLALYDTGLHSQVRDSLLADRAGLLARAVTFATQTAPRFERGHATSSGPGPRRGLGLLSDSTLFPLAYDPLCSALLEQVVTRLGARAAPVAVRAARAASETLGSFMSPDGDATYIGRRQQSAWSVAASVLVGTSAARLFAHDPGTAGRAQTIAARAFARLSRRYPLGSDGLSLVPRRIDSTNYHSGVDIESLGFNALAMFLLDEAVDAGQSPARPLPLTADRDGWFRDPDQQRFVAVRQGPIWFAVHAQAQASELRSDFGLVALKLRTASGAWVDLVRPRPLLTPTTALPSAGPVLRGTSGPPRVALPGRVAMGRGGEVTVTTRFGALSGHGSPGGLTRLRYTPGPRGVTLRFRAPAGHVAMTTFVPASEGGTRGGSVSDAAAVATLSPAQSVAVTGGLASCCDAQLDAVTVEGQVRARRGATGPVSYEVRARLRGEGFDPLPAGLSTLERLLLILVALAVMGAAVLVRRRGGQLSERTPTDRAAAAAARSSRAPHPSTGKRSPRRSPRRRRSS